MRFKNLLVYRLDAKWKVEARPLEKILAGRALQPCTSFEMESHGWVTPQPEGPFLYTQNRHWLCALGSEHKLLPASVVRQVAAERAAVLAKKQGHTIGRKQMREIKERVLHELLPRAYLMKTVWKTNYTGDTRTIEVHVRWLREMIETDPKKPKRLLTVRGMGYRLVI